MGKLDLMMMIQRWCSLCDCVFSPIALAFQPISKIWRGDVLTTNTIFWSQRPKMLPLTPLWRNLEVQPATLTVVVNLYEMQILNLHFSKIQIKKSLPCTHSQQAYHRAPWCGRPEWDIVQFSFGLNKFEWIKSNMKLLSKKSSISWRVF